MFAGVSLSFLIIKQRSPLFCRLKGFPNLINTSRNNNNKSINNGNMASSVLSYFFAEQRTRLDVEEVTCVHARVWVSERRGKTTEEVTFASLLVLTMRMSIHLLLTDEHRWRGCCASRVCVRAHVHTKGRRTDRPAKKFLKLRHGDHRLTPTTHHWLGVHRQPDLTLTPRVSLQHPYTPTRGFIGSTDLLITLS